MCIYIYIHTEENVCVCGLWVLLRAFVCMYVCIYIYIYIWGLELCRLGTGQYTVLIDIQAGIVIKSYIYSPIYTDIKYIRFYI